MPSRAGAGSVRWGCASPSPGTPLPPRLLRKVEGCSCHFPHFSFANKPQNSVVLTKNCLLHECRHIRRIYLAPFDKGPVPRAQGTALHSVSLHTGLGLPLWSSQGERWRGHPCVLHGDRPSAAAGGSHQPTREGGQPQPTEARGHPPKRSLLHLGTYQQLPLNTLVKCKSQNPLPH